MLSVTICGDSPAIQKQFLAVKTMEIEEVPITVGLMETPRPKYDLNAPENRSAVVVKVRAFSCNYRDKALVIKTSKKCIGKDKYACIGSEFVGEVIAVGPEVKAFQVGDRVMADNNFPVMSIPDVGPGIPTEHGSKRYLMLHEAKLIKVPPEMPDEVAAVFSLNAQTAYGMLRRLDIVAGANVLVTSARSNTSLFVINALKNYDCNVYVTTTSWHYEGDVEQLGIKEVIPIDPEQQSFLQNERMAEIYFKTGGFNYVIDPFFDLHLSKIIEVMALEGKYTTCGLYDQYSYLTGKKFHYAGRDLSDIITNAFIRNVQIVGNCLGTTADLQRAIDDYVQGNFNVVIDKVFSGDQVDAFFERTYNSRERFGKVVYRYDD
jgi:NADPH:quinone reductase-like Zn-dependent oxidoreductase